MLCALIAFVLGCTQPSTTDVRSSGSTDTQTTTGAHTGGDTAAPLSWVDIDMGYRHACGVLSDGRVVCWGEEEIVDEAHAQTEAVSDAVFVRASGFMGCALRAGGQVVCWCRPTATDSTRSICEDMPTDTAFDRVEIGSDFACGQRPDGTLRCWGYRSVFDDDDLPTGPVDDWDVDAKSGCALQDEQLQCWGLIDWKEPPPAGVTFDRITVGWSHACGLDGDDHMHCWGQAGYIDDGVQPPFPPAPTGAFADLVTEDTVTCGIRPDRTAECIYDSPIHEDIDDPPAQADGGPAWAPPDRTWADIGLGEWNGCGLTTDGEALCWPELWNASGQNDVPPLDTL